MRLVAPDAQVPLGGGQLRAVVDAVESAVVLERDGADEPAVLAGEADELGQVQLAGRRPTARATSIRRRSQAASKAYSPALTSLPSSSSSVASLASTMRSTVPNSLRTTRPSWAGSAAKTVASAIAASSSRRASRMASRSAAVMSGTSPDRTRISVASSAARPRAPARTASPVPRGSSWRAKVGLLGEGVADGLDRRRVARRPAARRPRRRRGGRGPRVEDVGQHRPPAQLVQDLGPGASACASRARPRGRRQRALGGPAGSVEPGSGTGLGGFMRGVGRAWGGRRPTRQMVPDGRKVSVIGWSPDGMGDPRASVKRARPRAMASISIRPPFGRAPDRERRAGRRRVGQVPGVDRVDRREVVDVGEEDGRLDHVGEGRARRHRGRRARLRSARSACASTPPSTSSPVAGSSAELAGAEHEVVGHDGLAVRADGGRGPRSW